jgi:anti-sigma B factor antagonist
MKNQVKIWQPMGVLDASISDSFRQEINNFIETDAEIILIDFTQVNFMDSSGLGSVVLALKNVKSVGKKLYICSINEQIKMLFQLTNMERVFAIYKNQDEFKEKILTKIPK